MKTYVPDMRKSYRTILAVAVLFNPSFLMADDIDVVPVDERLPRSIQASSAEAASIFFPSAQALPAQALTAQALTDWASNVQHESDRAKAAAMHLSRACEQRMVKYGSTQACQYHIPDSRVDLDDDISATQRVGPSVTDRRHPYYDHGPERRQGAVAGAIIGGLAGSAIAGDGDETAGAVIGAVIGGLFGSRKNAAPEPWEMREYYQRQREIQLRGLGNLYAPPAAMALYGYDGHWSVGDSAQKQGCLDELSC